ncbi:MAG: multi-sensor signal transduction histidine kinase [Actinomycetia bacterium]|nr:multi-sensor signal transduction histidine kinase [Actinomycetes bacterium]
MAAMHPIAGLDGDRLRPRLAGSVTRSARPVPAPARLRRLEPLAAVFLGLHGVMVLAGLGGPLWRWAAVGLVLALGVAGLGGRGPAWMTQVRAGAILVVGVALQATAGGAGGWFAAWPFVLVAVYPLALPGPAGGVVAGLAVLGYVLVVRLAGPAVGPALAVARGALLAGLAGLAWIAASAYARMANLAVEAELELGRRERLGRALLDALTDPTSVLDAQGRIVAANQAWVRFAAKDLAGLALAEVGRSYPAACAAAAAAGYDGLEPAARGVRAVLGGEVSLFRCRYQAPGGAGPCEVTVTPFADGDGAVVTHRPAAPAAGNPTHR